MQPKNLKPFTGRTNADPTTKKFKGYKKNMASTKQGWGGIWNFPDKGGEVSISRFNNSVGDATGQGTSGDAGNGGMGESLNESISINVLNDALNYYTQNASDYNDIEDYVNLDFPFASEEERIKIINYIKSDGKLVESKNYNEKYLDNRQLHILREKLARECGLPAVDIRLCPNGKFYIDNINASSANNILFKLQRSPIILQVYKTDGKYDFGHFDRLMQPTRKANIYGNVDLNSTGLLEGVFGDLAKGLVDRAKGAIKTHNDKKDIINAIFAALWRTKGSRDPVVFLTDNVTMSNRDIEKYIKQFAGNGISVYDNYSAFGGISDADRKKIQDAYGLSDKFKKEFSDLNSNPKLLLNNMKEKLDAAELKNNPQKRVQAIYQMYLWAAQNGHLKNLGHGGVLDELKQLGGDDKVFTQLEAAAKPSVKELSEYTPNDISPQAMKDLKTGKRLAFIFDDKMANKLSDSFIDQIKKNNGADLRKVKPEDFQNVQLNPREQAKLNKATNDVATASSNDSNNVQENLIEGDYDMTTSYDNFDIDYDDYNNELEATTDIEASDFYEHDPQLDQILAQLDNRLAWMVQDGICSRPEIIEDSIIVSCDPEPEIILEMNQIIHDICDGTTTNIEEDGAETVINFSKALLNENDNFYTLMSYEDAYNEVIDALNNCSNCKSEKEILNYLNQNSKDGLEKLDAALEGDLSYIIQDYLTSVPEIGVDEEDDFDFSNNIYTKGDPYVNMQKVDDSEYIDFDDVSPFDVNYDEEFEDDDFLTEAATSKKLTNDQQLKLKDAISKGDSDGVAALANQYAAANDPVKNQKAKEAGINLMA